MRVSPNRTDAKRKLTLAVVDVGTIEPGSQVRLVARLRRGARRFVQAHSSFDGQGSVASTDRTTYDPVQVRVMPSS
jgi:hypothetical protein